MSDTTTRTAERQESLWWIASAPSIWALHFLLSYATVSVWCGKLAAGGGLDGARAAIGWYTLVAMAGIGAVGWVGLRRHRYGWAEPPHDFDTPEDRHRFLGFATLLLAGLSAVATLFVALAAVYFDTCT